MPENQPEKIDFEISNDDIHCFKKINPMAFIQLEIIRCNRVIEEKDELIASLKAEIDGQSGSDTKS